MAKTVRVIYTGGTIGMVRTPSGFAAAQGTIAAEIASLLDAYPGQLPDVRLSELDPVIDSSNATPETWLEIAESIDRERDDFDGFVVLHGTDTMAYTASALSFMLPGFGKPIVVTGSQVPLCVARSDGRQNLIGALQVAADGTVREATLLFGSRLLRGNRATKVDASGLEAFDSPGLPALATLGSTIRYADVAPAPESPLAGRLLGRGSAHVAVVRLFPGFEPQLIESVCRPPMQGLVIEAYGAGNGPAADEAFLAALRAASERDVVTVVVTQCLRGAVAPGAYATGSAMLEAGAIPGYDMTTEAAVTKLRTLLASGLAAGKVRKLMTTDLAGEIAPKRH